MIVLKEYRNKNLGGKKVNGFLFGELGVDKARHERINMNSSIGQTMRMNKAGDGFSIMLHHARVL